MQIQVVIPHYNGFQMLSKCLDALREQTYTDFETIVIDNASSDGSADYVRTNYPEVHLIENDKNRGFAGAVNQGIRYATAPYVLLLNNDTVVFPDFLAKCFTKISSDKKIFAVSSHMLKVYEDCPTNIKVNDKLLNDNCGDIYTILGWAFSLGNGKKATDYMKDLKIFSACGGAALYRRSVFDKIGYFDEAFFAYREDIDICWRAKIVGYKTVYAGDALVYHLGSATTGGKYSSFKQFHGTRNTIWLHYKNMPILMHIINLPFLVFGHVVKFLYFLKKGYGMDYIKGVGAGISGVFTGKVRKNPFSVGLLFNYLKIEAELIRNCFMIK